MDNQQQVPNRKNSSKSSHWFAYCLAIAAVAIMAGILIKSIYPSPVTLNNSDQLKSINSELGIIREQVYSVESRISDMSFSLPRATYTVTAIR